MLQLERMLSGDGIHEFGIFEQLVSHDSAPCSRHVHPYNCTEYCAGYGISSRKGDRSCITAIEEHSIERQETGPRPYTQHEDQNC